MHSSTLLLYTATWAVVELTPGPAVLCSMGQATRHGFRASLVGIAGIQAGNIAFFGAVACGLAALLATATTAFATLRWIGALYLIYLGLRAIIGTFQNRAGASARSRKVPRHRSLFLQGLFIQLTNPKALLFVSALLPQFIDAAQPAIPQLAAMLAITVAVDCVVLCAYAFLAERSARRLGSAVFTRWLERVFGAALVFFGARLIFARK